MVCADIRSDRVFEYEHRAHGFHTRESWCRPVCHPFRAGSHLRSMVVTINKSRHTPRTFIYPVVGSAISKPKYRYPKRIPTLFAAIVCFKLTFFSANQPEFRRLLEATLAPLEVWGLVSQHCDNCRWRCQIQHQPWPSPPSAVDRDEMILFVYVWRPRCK